MMTKMFNSFIYFQSKNIY